MHAPAQPDPCVAHPSFPPSRLCQPATRPLLQRADLAKAKQVAAAADIEGIRVLGFLPSASVQQTDFTGNGYFVYPDFSPLSGESHCPRVTSQGLVKGRDAAQWFSCGC